MNHNVVEQLVPLLVDIETLTPDPNNARLHSAVNIEAVKKSLAEHGQRFPVVVQKTGMIIRAGNARVQAARELGWTHIAAVVIDETDEQALKFALRDNKTAELAEWDFETLGSQLKELATEGFDVTDLGFQQHELDVLLKGDWSPQAKEDDGSNSPGPGVGGGFNYRVTEGQRIVIDQALAEVRNDGGRGEFTDGECLAFICTAFLEGV